VQTSPDLLSKQSLSSNLQTIHSDLVKYESTLQKWCCVWCL